MLKQFQCTICGKAVLAFEDDIKNNLLECIETLVDSKLQCASHSCSFESAKATVANAGQSAVLHGEAGFFTEGTMFDSIDTIHDFCASETQKAEDARELNGCLEARRNQ